MPNEAIVMWGKRVQVNGSDIVTVNRLTGDVTLWDSKYRSSPRRIDGSPTFVNARTLENAKNQAANAIRNSDLPINIRNQALKNLKEGVLFTRTTGAGAVLNSVRR